MHGNTVLEAKTVAPELRELASLEGICVSVYLSGHRGGAGSRPLRVRLNAMLAEAGRMLEQRGLGAADRDQLLAPLIARAGEKFYRDSKTSHIEGTGLGIHLAQRFMEYHGGKLHFESEMGHGTTVRLFFPHSAALIEGA